MPGGGFVLHAPREDSMTISSPRPSLTLPLTAAATSTHILPRLRFSGSETDLNADSVYS